MPTLGVTSSLGTFLARRRPNGLPLGAHRIHPVATGDGPIPFQVHKQRRCMFPRGALSIGHVSVPRHLRLRRNGNGNRNHDSCTAATVRHPDSVNKSTSSARLGDVGVSTSLECLKRRDWREFAALLSILRLVDSNQRRPPRPGRRALEPEFRGSYEVATWVLVPQQRTADKLSPITGKRGVVQRHRWPTMPTVCILLATVRSS